MASVIKSTSKRMVIVETKSRKKKNEQKYPSVLMFIPISARKIAQKMQLATPMAKSSFLEKTMVLIS